MNKKCDEVLLNGCMERTLPNAVKNQIIWVLRDYNRLYNLASMKNNVGAFGPYEIVLYADDKEGLMSENVINSAVYKVNAINRVLSTIPLEYRKGLIDNICNNKKFDVFASENTWEMWKDRLIHGLAKDLDLC